MQGFREARRKSASSNASDSRNMGRCSAPEHSGMGPGRHASPLNFESVSPPASLSRILQGSGLAVRMSGTPRSHACYNCASVSRSSRLVRNN